MENVNIYNKNGHTTEAKQHILDLITYCRKIRPFIHYYRDQTNSFNYTAHNILINEIGLILPQFTDRKEKRGIITSLISGFMV